MPTLKAALASVGKDNQSALETDNATSLRPATSPCHQRFSARAFIVSSILASLLTCFVCYIGFGGSGSDIRLHSCPTCSECTACAELISPSCPVNPAPAFAAASQPKAMPQPKPSTDRKQNPYPMLKSVTKNLPEKSHRVALSTEETKVAPPTKVHNPCVHQISSTFTILRIFQQFIHIHAIFLSSDIPAPLSRQ